MIIKTEKINNINIISIQGRLDSNTAGELEQRLLPTIDQGETHFILDFSELDYISSAGLRVLLQAAKKINAVCGKMAICAVKPEVKEVFDIAGLTIIFKMFDNPDSAVKAIL
ncbi:MAG: STAS domain-containing protein [Candidatus Neomarinimicrobiota bacterium]